MDEKDLQMLHEDNAMAGSPQKRFREPGCRNLLTRCSKPDARLRTVEHLGSTFHRKRHKKASNCCAHTVCETFFRSGTNVTDDIYRVIVFQVAADATED